MDGFEDMGFESFCDNRLVPENIKNDFMSFFIGVFKKFLVEDDDEILRLIMTELPHQDIEKYWNKYILKIKHEDIGG